MGRTLSEKEFSILVEAEQAQDAALTQRELATRTGYSVGTVNKLCAQLSEQGLLEGTVLTEAGRDALEPYRVQRAVLIAAGFGERMVPITLNTPKPLVRVQGRRIIESLLDALEQAGITELWIVRGYLGEQFEQLLSTHPTIRFIDNTLYNEANNISSAYAARDLLANAYVLESDILLANPALIKKYQYKSNYVGFPVERTDDWCLTTNRHGLIESVAVGGVDCYQMCGISYWTEEDGRKLAEDIKTIMEQPGGRERYWDEVPLRHCRDHHDVYVRTCEREDLIEIDTFRELQALDPAYQI